MNLEFYSARKSGSEESQRESERETENMRDIAKWPYFKGTLEIPDRDQWPKMEQFEPQNEVVFDYNPSHKKNIY